MLVPIVALSRVNDAPSYSDLYARFTFKLVNRKVGEEISGTKKKWTLIGAGQ